MPFRAVPVKSQRASLEQIARLIERGSVDPYVRQVALTLTNDCAGRDESCELQAIYDAVKHGDPRVPELRQGVRYVADPRDGDYFTGAPALLRLCQKGACGEDCDGHTILVGSLLAAIGYRVGARAWRQKGSKEYVHVYAVAFLPKRGPFTKAVGLDTTVPDATVGWEPPATDPKQVLTAWTD